MNSNTIEHYPIQQYPENYPEIFQAYRKQIDEDFDELKQAFAKFSEKYGNLICGFHLLRIHNSNWYLKTFEIDGALLDRFVLGSKD